MAPACALVIISSIAVLGQINIVDPRAAAASCENLEIANVTAIGYQGSNVPANTIDNNLKTRWSHEGTGSWITADLGEQKTGCSVAIAWYKGDVRVNNFVISVSADGKSYVDVYSGKNSKTTSPQTYSFSETIARYIKITVNGNNQNQWASITEIDVYGYISIDETAPSVKISNPLDDSTISALATSLLIEGTAADNIKVDRVEVRVNSASYKMATPKAAGDWSTWTVTVDTGSFDTHQLISRATDSSGNQAWNSIYVTVTESSSGVGSTSATLDDFGIEKIYATKSGGNEWYVDMDDPTSDPLFRNLPSMTRQSDGSWQVSGGSKGQVRMEAWSPAGEKWLNVEITGYAKMVSGSNELIQWYSRGGHHTSSNECLGSAVKARLYGDGEARWVKEISHPAYTGNRGNMQATNEPLADRWIGFKAVIYNFMENDSTYVRMESYIDDHVTDANGNLVIDNNWELASVVEDRGGWSTGSSDFNPSCSPLNKDSSQQYRQRDEILNMSGGTSTQNIAAFRSDNLTWNWKYLSVREITAP